MLIRVDDSNIFLLRYLARAAACARCLAIEVVIRIVIITDTGALSPGGDNLATLEGRLLPPHNQILSVILSDNSGIERG